MPRITFAFVIVAVLIYIVGARYPQLAQRFGIA